MWLWQLREAAANATAAARQRGVQQVPLVAVDLPCAMFAVRTAR